jgi:nucleoside 2-deoxyribosyltransferase
VETRGSNPLGGTTHKLGAQRPKTAVTDTRHVKLYFAAPLFTAAERKWNAEIAEGLRAARHEVFLPQEQEPDRDAAGIFSGDVGGIDWADGLVAVMDGPDPDSGTSWEVGYAFGKKPIVLIRTDIRALIGYEGGYNAMLTQSATIRVDLPAASTTEVVGAVLEALEKIQAASSRASSD